MAPSVVSFSSSGYRERTFHSQDGLELYFRDYGDHLDRRPAVLCLAGVTRNSKDFHDLARRLAGGRRVLCPDYRGRGHSAYDSDWRRYKARTYVYDIRHLLAAADVHRVVVIGTSLGAVLAMVMAVAMPTAVAGALLNDLGPRIEAAGLQPIIDYMKDDRSQPDWAAATRRLRETFPDLPAETDDEWLAIARNTYREAPDGNLRFDWDAKIVKAFAAAQGRSTDLWPLFRALRKVPLLAVRGEKSGILSEKTFLRMAEEMPHMDHVTVAGVGHPPALDEPEVLEAIDALLAKI
jgi:pimeloyl-ACP methyl ester carboxylesterase